MEPVQVQATTKGEEEAEAWKNAASVSSEYSLAEDSEDTAAEESGMEDSGSQLKSFD